MRTLEEHKRDAGGIDPPLPTQLEGRFLSSKTILPRRADVRTRLARLFPKTTHPGGVHSNGRGTVFHPLNGSGAKGTTGRSNAGRRPIERYPKGFHPRNNISAQAIYPVVPYLPKIFTGLPFLFRSPEPLFLL